MGSVVKAITKPFKSIVSGVGGVVSAMLGERKSQPQIVNQTTAPAAQAAPQVQPQQATGPDESGGGGAESAALRAGKKKLTIRRTNVGGGSGLNV